MKRRVIYSPQATETLERLYIEMAASGTPETALRFIQDIETRCDILAEFPKLGRARDDLIAGVRLITFDRRVAIAYRIRTRHILIAKIFWRGQDFESALRARPSAED